MATFLDSVNRIFRMNTIIRGDTDALTNFSGTQHNASMQVAIIAVQNELAELIADRLIPKERTTTGSITTASGTRVYDLAADFRRFYGVASLYNASANRRLYEYPGGLEKLQQDIYAYATQAGDPNWWYWEPVSSANKQIGFFPVPDGGRTYAYDYEASVMVSAAGDNMPFHSDEENWAFADMAGRRFKFMFEDVKNELDIARVLMRDESYRTAKARLMHFLRGQNARHSYGAVIL